MIVCINNNFLIKINGSTNVNDLANKTSSKLINIFDKYYSKMA